ncbi:MAG: hypothetical protein ACE5D0_07395 [Fidelibacterota bacterium]
MKYTFVIFVILIFSASCNKGPKKEIVFIDPIQCLGNPWDADWLESHKYNEYPQTESGRLQIFEDYYNKQGITMYDVYSEWVYNAVCDACFCPTGERYYCTVDAGDVDFLLESGFQLE